MNPSVSISVRTFATRRFRIAAVLLGVMLGVTGQARSGTVVLDFTGGSLGTASTNLTAGWTFTLSAPTTVGGLAFWTLATSVVQSHQVGLWDGSGALLASTTISGSGTTSDPSTGLGGRWLENPISPLTLTTGQTYTLGAFYATSSPDNVVFLASTVTTIPGVTYGGTAISAGGSLIKPASGTPGSSFFGPNLVLAPGPVPDVPEIDPGSAAGALALLVMGATMLNGRCRGWAA